MFKMKALSIMQPWAWLIVMGYKPVENRDWQPHNPGLKFRGEFLIHAGKKYDKEGAAWIQENFPEIPLPKGIYGGPESQGGIVGIGELHDVVRQHESEWFFGPIGLCIRNARPLPFMPYRGQLGFFDVEYDENARIAQAMDKLKTEIERQ